MSNSEKRLYRVKEAAEITGLHPVTIRRLCQSGKIPAHKIGAQWFIEDLVASNSGWVKDTSED